MPSRTNVVPFTKQRVVESEFPDRLRAAIVHLDLCMLGIRRIIEKCPAGKSRDDLEAQFLDLHCLLEFARALAKNDFSIGEAQSVIR
jgi:hypothetical protein